LPVIKQFQEFIESNGDMYMDFHLMFKGATDPFVSDTMLISGI
jgi:hypothetical protein